MKRTKNPIDSYIGLKIKITQCWHIGYQHNKMFPGTIHTIITPKKGEINGDGGVWVQGTDEPVKAHFDEFIFLKRNK